MSKYFKKTIFVAQLVLIALISSLTVQAAGEVDTNFSATLARVPGGTVVESVIQPDGKIIIAGSFEAVGKYPRNYLARLNADGTLDTTFNPSELLETASDNIAVSSLALQSDGKILIGGRFLYQGQIRAFLRLNQNGSVDSEFSSRALFDDIGGIYEIFVYPDDRVLYSGWKINNNNPTSFTNRLDTSGNLEAGTVYPMRKIGVQPDGKIIGLVNNTLRRFNANLSEDATFQISTNGYADFAVQPDGKIIVGGTFVSLFGFPISRIGRLNADGTVDGTFNTSNPGQPNAAVSVVRLLSNGQVLIGGAFTAVNGMTTNCVARLNGNDGGFDQSFVSQSSVVPNDLDVQIDGKILVSGNTSLVRLNSNGTIDSSFVSASIGEQGFGFQVLAQPDNKFFVAGRFNRANEKQVTGLAKFNADGTIDNSFNPPFLNEEGFYSEIALQPDGKVIVGNNFNGSVVRLNTDGSPDITFENTSGTYDIEVLPDGKVLIAGRFNLLRFNADGSLDNSFATLNLGSKSVFKIALQPDGKILIGGDFTEINGVSRSRIARLDADGNVDPTFAPNGGANGSVQDLALQPDGKVIIGGDFSGVNFDLSKKYVARLNANGSLDTSFTSPDLTMFVKTIRRQANGRLLVGGLLHSTTVTPYLGKIVRLNLDGTLDRTFNNSLDPNGVVASIDLQSDNKILLAGSFRRIGGVANLGVARLLNLPTTARNLFDFDGDGKSDLSVFRPSNGAWYVQQSANGFSGQLFGQSGDRIAPADYDGDGKADIAVYRGGTWYIQRSSLGFTGVTFGASNDVLVPADYDGDGKADIAVFRPANGTWYRLNSSNGQFVAVQFGQAEDKPVLGDYDGDGKSDIAVFRPSNGTWYLLRSQLGFTGTPFGQAGDIVVPADYDGDGKADLAVFRGGAWYIQRSQLGFAGITWGDANDKPVPADYDGDGDADVSIYRPSNGTWHLLGTTQGYTATPFGIAEDNPIPNAFVR